MQQRGASWDAAGPASAALTAGAGRPPDLAVVDVPAPVDVPALVDRRSPGLLQLAVLFAPDRDVAERMVLQAWCRLLRDARRTGALPGPAVLRGALVRALGVADPASVTDPDVAAAAREVRVAVRSAGCYVPQQAEPDDRFAPLPSPAPVAGPGALVERLRALPGALRLVLLLSDGQHWPAVEVEELLEVTPAARRALLAHARDRLVRDRRTRAA